ncbi:MAG: GAF domain-containing protein [Acidobacteriota bacterium]
MPTLEQILITPELDRRDPLIRDFRSEHAAYVELASVLATTPETLLHRLVELAIQLCGAGTAGVSLLEPGEQAFRWVALAGAYAESRGNTVPAAFSPCGDCLSRGALQLYSRPGRMFDSLAVLSPPIVECLIVPLHTKGAALGTIWVMTHKEGPGFTRRDADVMTGLASVTAAGLLMHAARVNAEAAIRASQKHLADVSHDLRASLTPVLGWTGMLLSGRATPAHAARAIASIHGSVELHTRLIDALLDETRDRHA